jgi:Domain of unknown function (DUF1918)
MPNASRAHVGDLIVVEGRRLGEPRRVGEILEVLGTAGHAHYCVRWDDGHEAIFYPGGDAVIQHAPHSEEEPGLVHKP